ncbi:NmrA family NAD(P)-binding protein [Caulobacter sp. 1776]|uniref:NmrA family NAD(P)-binding protein n=1 Tax=Caulobacter sp. 1776 TaxID=3156420 RepID=UPI0033935C17
MYAILGATGHVGSAVVDTLLEAGEPVLALVHSADHAGALLRRGAEVAIVDVLDVDALRALLKQVRRAFLLNPPAAVSGDTDVDERATVAAILAALDGSGLEKVVAESTMGAQPGERLGDLNVLYDLEQGLRAQPIPAAWNRAAYYMSNWDMALESARQDGVVQTMFPADFILPMVAPRDLGQAAARRLRSGLDDVGLVNVEGPARYSMADVAKAFAGALGRPVRAVVTPREQWVEAFKALGFSQAAADSYARMTGATLDGEMVPESQTEKGPTTLEAYIAALAEARG